MGGDVSEVPVPGCDARVSLTRAAAGIVAAALAAATLAGAAPDSRRDERLQPERVMDVVGIRPGMVVG
jgi:hypothetical protein